MENEAINLSTTNGIIRRHYAENHTAEYSIKNKQKNSTGIGNLDADGGRHIKAASLITEFPRTISGCLKEDRLHNQVIRKQLRGTSVV